MPAAVCSWLHEVYSDIRFIFFSLFSRLCVNLALLQMHVICQKFLASDNVKALVGFDAPQSN